MAFQRLFFTAVAVVVLLSNASAQADEGPSIETKNNTIHIMAEDTVFHHDAAGHVRISELHAMAKQAGVDLEDLSDETSRNVTMLHSLLHKVSECLSMDMLLDTNDMSCVARSPKPLDDYSDDACADSNNEGRMFRDSSRLVLCDRGEARVFTEDLPGSRMYPAESCADIVSTRQEDGTYWVKTADNGRKPVYCRAGEELEWYPPFEDVLPEPVFYFPFDRSLDDKRGATPLTKRAGTTAYGQGRVGDALSLDGSTSFLLGVPQSIWHGPYTLVGWFNFDDTFKASDNGILGQGKASDNQGLHIGERSSGPYFGFYGNDISVAESLEEGRWHFVAYIYDGLGNKKIYINGHIRAQGNGDRYEGVGETWLGDYAYSPNNNMGGLIDDLMLFDQALSETTLRHLFHRYPYNASDCEEIEDLGYPNSLYWFDSESGTPGATFCVGGKPSRTPPFYITGFPLAYYPFNGDVEDEIGVFNPDTTDLDVSKLVYADGVEGQGLDFQQSIFLSIPSLRDYVWRGSFSVSVWVYLRENDNEAIIGHGEDTARQGLHLEIRGGKAYFGLFNNDIGSNSDVSTNQWYHLGFVMTGSALQIYINGELDVSATSSEYIGSGTNTEFGRYPWSTSVRFHGIMDELIIFDKALTPAHVRLLATNSFDRRR